ncbi:acyltransferase family protein [Spirosoma foliorum]|uniref:Acyltransferase family protein n=1 Tax=Spirosoma foliorum TaxID=2710596 RepID=A0A7G5H6L8_9BACT|nr:acyltransferase family protein [Spirosoma foliorum]QMW06760.1 acyltransferase family protein [Spirosoma foliorum]
METTDLQTSERVYALDALRSIMMLLGIVLHGSAAYIVTKNELWPLPDSANSLLFDLTCGFIHCFRMPVFFVASGFFCALLLYKKGPRAMLINRFKRIVLPLLVFTLILGPLETFVITYSGAKLSHALFPLQTGWKALTTGKFLPFQVDHLWFIYFLALYAGIGWLLVMVFQKAETYTETVRRLTTIIIQNFWVRILAWASCFFFVFTGSEALIC